MRKSHFFAFLVQCAARAKIDRCGVRVAYPHIGVPSIEADVDRALFVDPLDPRLVATLVLRARVPERLVGLVAAALAVSKLGAWQSQSVSASGGR